MGTSQSHDGFDLADSDSDPYTEEEEEEDEQEQYDDAKDQQKPQISPTTQANSKSLVEVDTKLKSLKLKYGASFCPSSSQNLYSKNSVKLYLHIGGNTPKAKWIVDRDAIEVVRQSTPRQFCFQRLVGLEVPHRPSSSTSSSSGFHTLVDENKRLKKANVDLNSELISMKKKCKELLDLVEADERPKLFGVRLEVHGEREIMMKRMRAEISESTSIFLSQPRK